MKTTYASPAELSAEPAAKPGVMVWDWPVRVFHWLMVLSFAGAYLTAESESWRLLHVTLGYTMVGLVGFRIVWGLVGSRYAKFSSFVRGPAAVARYVRSLVERRPEHHVGHNPAGALAILALLGLTLAIGASGWAVYNDVGAEWLEELHEVAANLMLTVVGVHIAGVLLGSWLHRENLVGSMIHGRKAGRPEDGVRSAWRSVAALMLVAVLGFWWLQWQGAPGADAQPGIAATASVVGGHDRDDD
ncbi:MAG: cytochrome b/b6 domain-containing protein [Burkholderiaceae bacterium]|nr:cytochrome b/b6 domain-containing protein [Burkholderiaceae bacterium]